MTQGQSLHSFDDRFSPLKTHKFQVSTTANKYNGVCFYSLAVDTYCESAMSLILGLPETAIQFEDDRVLMFFIILSIPREYRYFHDIL